MNQRGFTLVELALVIVLIGILSAYVLSRNNTDFTAFSGTEELMQAIRYAQQQSMEHTGAATIGIQLSNDGFTFINTSSLGVAWGLEKPSTSYSVNINPTGTITFNGRGVPTCSGGLNCSTSAQAITVSANGKSETFYLEPYTGFTHR